MTLISLEFQPGINKEWTDYAAEGGWVDGDKVRFRKGRPEKIGGWGKVTSNTFLGVCRAIHTWSDLSSAIRGGLGTHLKYYIEEGGVFYDVTPIRSDVTLGTDPITTDAAASGIITVTHASHGAILNDYVTFSGATAVDGITADEINTEHQITEIVNANSYKVDTGGSASAGSVSGGGASVDAEYQINTGSIDFVAGQGWGAGTWSNSDVGWGEANTAASIGGTAIRLWTHDNFGEDLIINPRGGEVYYWDTSNGTSTRAVALSTLGGASDTPTNCNIVLVSENRQVIGYGTNSIGTSTQDPMLVRWTDEEDATNWTPSPSNSAGGYRLGVGSGIVAAEKARQEILIWTTSAIYSQRFTGAPYYWGFSLLSQNVSIISPSAAIMADSIMYWMDNGTFYRYTGRVEVVPCSVLSYVFDDLNYDQSYKVVAGGNSAYGEVWWFYPSVSGGTDEIDRYVMYNYKENSWSIGTLVRTAWEESRLRSNPIAAGTDNYLWNHELGENADGAAMASYIQSADMDMTGRDGGEGDRLYFAHRLIPDMKMSNGEVTIKLNMKNYPQDTERTPVSVTVLPSDTKKSIRARGRHMNVRVESDFINTDWRLGNTRVDVRADGRRE